MGMGLGWGWDGVGIGFGIGSGSGCDWGWGKAKAKAKTKRNGGIKKKQASSKPHETPSLTTNQPSHHHVSPFPPRRDQTQKTNSHDHKHGSKSPHLTILSLASQKEKRTNKQKHHPTFPNTGLPRARGHRCGSSGRKIPAAGRRGRESLGENIGRLDQGGWWKP